jgi:DNA-binding winged helix-turn-helix (wHTH) protein
MGIRVRVGDVLVDGDARELSRGGDAIHLSPKAFELLLLLIEFGPRAVSKRELQDRLWPDTFVVEKNLTNLIAEIRKAVGDTSSAPRVIRTVQRFGYALRDAAPVVDVEPARLAGATRIVRLSWDGGAATLREGDHIVGRDPAASIVLNADSVSRRHAVITVAGGYATVSDLGSKNGTSVGSTRIHTPTRLVDGDRIHIGSVRLTVRMADPLDSTRTETHPSTTG